MTNEQVFRAVPGISSFRSRRRRKLDNEIINPVEQVLATSSASTIAKLRCVAHDPDIDLKGLMSPTRRTSPLSRTRQQLGLH
jgi:hypothetical protein